MFSDSTKACYRSMRNSYLRFCRQFNRTPVPADSTTVSIYCTYLARTLAATSISSYLNVIKLMHDELGLPNPLCSWDLQAVQKRYFTQVGENHQLKNCLFHWIFCQIFMMYLIIVKRCKCFGQPV